MMVEFSFYIPYFIKKHKQSKKENKMREPRVENKYHLKPADIRKAIVINEKRLHKAPFWRNNIISAWCLSDNAGKGYYGPMDSYWIGFYDKDAKAYAGKVRMSCDSYEEMCNYQFKTFFNPKDIEFECDLELQEKLLDRMNWLIDEEIIRIPGIITCDSGKKTSKGPFCERFNCLCKDVCENEMECGQYLRIGKLSDEKW